MKKGGKRTGNERPAVQMNFVDLILAPSYLLEDKIIIAGTKPVNTKVGFNLYPTKSVSGFSSTKKISISSFENCKKQGSQSRIVKEPSSTLVIKPTKSYSTPLIPQLPEIKKDVRVSNSNIGMPSSSRITAKGFQGYKFSTLYTNRSLIKSNLINRIFN